MVFGFLLYLNRQLAKRTKLQLTCMRWTAGYYSSQSTGCKVSRREELDASSFGLNSLLLRDGHSGCPFMRCSIRLREVSSYVFSRFAKERVDGFRKVMHIAGSFSREELAGRADDIDVV